MTTHADLLEVPAANTKELRAKSSENRLWYRYDTVCRCGRLCTVHNELSFQHHHPSPRTNLETLCIYPRALLATHVEIIPSLLVPADPASIPGCSSAPRPTPPNLAKLSPILTPRFMFMEAIMFIAFRGFIAPAVAAAAAAAFHPPSLESVPFRIQDGLP